MSGGGYTEYVEVVVVVAGLKSSSREINFIPKFPPRHPPRTFNHTMEAATLSISALRAHIAATEQELLRLKSQLLNLEKKEKEKNVTSPSKWPLSSEEYKRYGRQMIVPSIGLSGTSPSLLSNLNF